MRLTEKDVGKRLLIKETPITVNTTPNEVKILEVSPSEKYVKIHPINGSKHWVEQSKYAIIEELHSYDKTSSTYHLIGIDIATNEDNELVINGIPY